MVLNIVDVFIVIFLILGGIIGFKNGAIKEGTISGVLGILVTIILNIPANIIIKNLVGISNISKLPIAGGIILVLISISLTFIAGLIPSKFASRKDPVEALRSE